MTRLFTVIDLQNAQCTAHWHWKRQLCMRFPDLRGDISGPTLDQVYEMKRMVARELLKDIKASPRRKTNVVYPKFRRVR